MNWNRSRNRWEIAHGTDHHCPGCAGSRSFGPETVRDILLSEALTQGRINLRLMDIVADRLSDISRYAKSLGEKLGRSSEISTTTSLEAALDGAQFVVTAVEIERSLYWAQDYHIPRKYGFVRFSPRTAGRGRSSMPCQNSAGSLEICASAPESARICLGAAPFAGSGSPAVNRAMPSCALVVVTSILFGALVDRHWEYCRGCIDRRFVDAALPSISSALAGCGHYLTDIVDFGL